MLVLARRVNERIVIPCVGATIQVVALRPTLVRLGIDAPPEVVVLREEVAEEPGRGGGAPGPAAPLGRLLRCRLNHIARGLASLQRQLQGNPAPGLLAAVTELAEECRLLQGQLQAAWDEEAGRRVVPAMGL